MENNEDKIIQIENILNIIFNIYFHSKTSYLNGIGPNLTYAEKFELLYCDLKRPKPINQVKVKTAKSYLLKEITKMIMDKKHVTLEVLGHQAIGLLYDAMIYAKLNPTETLMPYNTKVFINAETLNLLRC